MKKRYIAVVAGMLMGASSMAAAEMGVGVKTGTLGHGAEFTVGLTDSLNARVGLNGQSFSQTEIEGDIKYDLDLDWQTVGAFLDWHPMNNGFRLSLGYMQNNNEIGMEAKPAGNYVIGNQTYTAAEVGKLTGTVKFDDGLFYGLGWGNAADGKGLGFVIELGILQQMPSLDLKSSGGLVSDDPSFQAELKKEEDKAQDDLEDFDQYPVIAIGLSYSF